MFGYIRTVKEELKIREYDKFRAYYCGLCLELKKRYGELPRLILNYDSTFLALFLSSLNEENEKETLYRCYLHPLKKRRVVVDNPYLAFGADVNILLAYHNLQDKWRDDKSKLAFTAHVLLKQAYKKARQLHPELDEVIATKTRELWELEQGRCADLDRVADTFGGILETIVAHHDYSPARLKALKWLGYNMGKWIYLVDALDDLGKDIAQHSYNPLVYAFEYQGQSVEDFRHSVRAKMDFTLTYTLSQIAQTYEVLDIKQNAGILENIIYIGMMHKTRHILNGKGCGQNEKILRSAWGEGRCHEGRDPAGI